MLTYRGLGRVLGDLAAMGFDARWGVLGAADVGANHQRDRIWIVAKWRKQLSYAQHHRIGQWEQQQKGIEKTSRNVADSMLAWQWGNERQKQNETDARKISYAESAGQPSRQDETLKRVGRPLEKQFGGSGIGAASEWWQFEPNVGRMADGVAAKVDRLKAIGNGQVPLCAATAWRILNAPCR